MTSIDLILIQLEQVKKYGKGYKACCPAHADSDPSLQITQIPDGRILMHCYAGCEIGDILSALGLSISDLFPDGGIQDHLKGATPWLRKQRSRDQTVLQIAQADRNKGKRLSFKDLKTEREAFLRQMNHK